MHGVEMFVAKERVQNKRADYNSLFICDLAAKNGKERW